MNQERLLAFEQYLGKYVIVKMKWGKSYAGVISICWHSPNLLYLTNKEACAVINYEDIASIRKYHEEEKDAVVIEKMARNHKFIVYDITGKKRIKAKYKNFEEFQAAKVDYLNALKR